MGISKTEVNLRRLLAAAPQQQNQAKLVHVSLKIFIIINFRVNNIMSIMFFLIFLTYMFYFSHLLTLEDTRLIIC